MFQASSYPPPGGPGMPMQPPPGSYPMQMAPGAPQMMPTSSVGHPSPGQPYNPMMAAGAHYPGTVCNTHTHTHAQYYTRYTIPRVHN